MRKRSAYKPKHTNPKAHMVALMGVQFMTRMDQMVRVVVIPVLEACPA